jgi:hypothetical protein
VQIRLDRGERFRSPNQECYDTLGTVVAAQLPLSRREVDALARIDCNRAVFGLKRRSSSADEKQFLTLQMAVVRTGELVAGVDFVVRDVEVLCPELCSDESANGRDPTGMGRVCNVGETNLVHATGTRILSINVMPES